jgi:hypothetical protein
VKKAGDKDAEPRGSGTASAIDPMKALTPRAAPAFFDDAYDIHAGSWSEWTPAKDEWLTQMAVE